MIRAILADVILVAHFALAAFISLGLVLIWLGIASSWQWIRQRGFRLLHLSAIVFVALEAVAGVVCPLTVWEDALRQSSGEQPSFIARWVQRLLYYEFPEWVFTTAYIAAAIATAIAWLIAPPKRGG